MKATTGQVKKGDRTDWDRINTTNRIRLNQADFEGRKATTSGDAAESEMEMSSFFKQPQMIEIADPRLGPRDKKDIEDPKFAPYLFKTLQICKTLNDGSILRIFRALLGGPYKVQRICNPGVLDRRRKPASRERREIILTTTDRGAAVILFNRLLVQPGAQP